jgi:hypothetical protein
MGQLIKYWLAAVIGLGTAALLGVALPAPSGASVALPHLKSPVAPYPAPHFRDQAPWPVEGLCLTAAPGRRDQPSPRLAQATSKPQEAKPQEAKAKEADQVKKRAKESAKEIKAVHPRREESRPCLDKSPGGVGLSGDIPAEAGTRKFGGQPIRSRPSPKSEKAD